MGLQWRFTTYLKQGPIALETRPQIGSMHYKETPLFRDAKFRQTVVTGTICGGENVSSSCRPTPDPRNAIPRWMGCNQYDSWGQDETGACQVSQKQVFSAGHKTDHTLWTTDIWVNWWHTISVVTQCFRSSINVRVTPSKQKSRTGRWIAVPQALVWGPEIRYRRN